MKKCSFCFQQTFKRGLIDINSKVYGLFDECIDFDLKTIIFAVTNIHVSFPVQSFGNRIKQDNFFNFQLDDGKACDECHKNLVDSYIFKINASKALNNVQLTLRSELIKEFTTFIDGYEKLENFSRMQNKKCFTVLTTSFKEQMDRERWRNFKFSFKEESDRVRESLSDSESVEVPMMQPVVKLEIEDFPVFESDTNEVTCNQYTKENSGNESDSTFVLDKEPR